MSNREFFTSWEIWEKLVFILACAMVVTVILGCAKLVYAHWKLRKFTAIAEQERQEQNMNRSMSQRRRQSGGQPSDDVPFGIRAIESGIEVEGVWISRDNTPEPSSRNISVESSMYELPASKGFELDLEKQAADHTRSISSSTVATIEPNWTTYDKVVSAETITDRSGNRDSSPVAVTTKLVRKKYPPLSYAKYGCNPYLVRYSMPARTLVGLDAIHRASTSIRGEDSNESSDSSHPSTDSTGDIDPISASAPALLTGLSKSHAKQPSSSDLDLGLLDSHRVSQAAECGQLTPRGRRPGQSYSVDLGSGRHGWQTDPRQRKSYFDSRPKLTSSTSDTAASTAVLPTPNITALPPAFRRSSMPDVTPFAEFCKRAPHDGRPESLRSRSRDSGQSAATTQSETKSPVDSAASSPIMPASEGAAEMKLPVPKRMSFEKRTPQVLRGHGTGFEILKPGSLNPSPPKEHPIERQRAVPPISLQNTYRPRSGSEDGRNRLQKKRRPSEGSTASSTVSRQSRISLFA